MGHHHRHLYSVVAAALPVACGSDKMAENQEIINEYNIYITRLQLNLHKA